MRKFVSLLSSGLDSPIAAYFMMKREFNPVFISFLTSDDINHTMKKKVLRIIDVLKKLTKRQIKVYFINHDPNLELLRDHCERKLTCILCKRLMIRIAKEIGKIEGTNLIVTGDILGEQASQTLDNLYAYNDLLKDYIIIRPLIGRDKLEIIKANQEIGLYTITSESSPACQFNPQYPETHAKLGDIFSAESLIDASELIQISLKNSEVLNL